MGNHLLKGGEGGRKVFIYSKVNYLENLDTLYEKKTTGFDGKFPFLPLFVTLRTVFVNQQDPLDAASHADLVELFPHALKSGGNRRITFKQWIFGSKSVIRQRVQVDVSVQC